MPMCIKFILLCIFSVFAFIDAAYANTAGQCNLSGIARNGLQACAGSLAGGNLTSNSAVTGTGLCNGSNFCGTYSDTSKAVSPINAWGVCRWVDNTSPNVLFVPFRSALEWSSFRSNAPSLYGGNSIKLTSCAGPRDQTAAPAQINVVPPFSSCTGISVATPNVYGRTGVSRFPSTPEAGPNFTCHAGNTSMMSSIQWLAGNIETTTSGNTSWNTDFKYSPDMNITVSSPIVDEGTPVTISWNIQNNSNISSCGVTGGGGGWGPNSSGLPRVGTSSIILFSSTTFSLRCTDVNGLTSVSSRSVTVTPTCSSCECLSTCGDGGGDGDGGGGDGGGDGGGGDGGGG